ncbi:hypothetical protein ACQPW3_36430 [Actinosynnema sp. CA-248983]
MSLDLRSALRAVEDAATEAVSTQRHRAQHARGLLLEIGLMVGVDLQENPLGTGAWSTTNVRRLLDAVDGLRRQNAQLRGLPPDGFAPRPLGERIELRERGW